MMKIIPRLVEIAAREGRQSLIDTEAERELAVDFLLDAADGDQQALSAALDLTEFPEQAFQINFNTHQEFEGFCEPVEFQDCDRLLIPLGPGDYCRFAVSSGGMWNDYVDYVPISSEAWDRIVSPFQLPVTSHEEEDDRLIAAVDLFEAAVSASDVKGALGNALW